MDTRTKAVTGLLSCTALGVTLWFAFAPGKSEAGWTPQGCPPTFGGPPTYNPYPMYESPMYARPAPKPSARMPAPVRPRPEPVVSKITLPGPDELGITLKEQIEIPPPEALGINPK